MKYKYPCTRHISLEGFGQFLENESKSSRYNINCFADELKNRFKVPNITLVNSGSSANLVAALAFAEKIKRDNKPLTAVVSAFTFPTTISSLVLAGFEISIVDTEKDGFNISYEELEKLYEVGNLPTLIVATHFLGFPFAVKETAELAHKNGGYLLQDGCETLGMEVENTPIFEYGDITTWSFYHPHHMSSYGGGAVITLNQDDYLLVDSVAHWGRSCKCHVNKELCKVPEGPAHQFTYERVGVNVEISELNACFGRWQLQKWEQYEEARLNNYNYLYEELRNIPNIRVWEAPDINSSAFVFPIQVTDGRNIKDAYNDLSKESVEIRTLMGGVSNEQKAFVEILGKDLQSNAHEIAETTFFVGIHQTLSSEDVNYVCMRIKEFAKKDF